MNDASLVGKAGTGAVLSLDAKGLQDTFLTSSNVQQSFFNFENVRHTPFTKFESAHKVVRPPHFDGTNWPFDTGSSIKFTLDPQTMGDCLSNMYLKVTLPKLIEVVDTSNTGSSNVMNVYCDFTGRAIINSVSLNLEGTELEKLTNDWMIIHDQMYHSQEEKRAGYRLLNGSQNGGWEPDNVTLHLYNDSVNQSGPVNLYIPLPFFFSRHHTGADTDNDWQSQKFFKPYFPLCGILKQTLTVDIQFNPVTFFSNTIEQCSLTDITLVTEEITLSPQERTFIQSNRQQLMYEKLFINPKYETGPSPPVSFTTQLVPIIPIKTFYWFYRNIDYESVSDANQFKNRYNFSTLINTDQPDPQTETVNQVIKGVKFYFNIGSQNDFLAYSNYYRFAVPSSTGLTPPMGNIYTYSFVTNPKEPRPVGSLNFDIMNSGGKSLMETHTTTAAQSNNYSVNVFFTGYQVFQCENGYGEWVYSGG